MDSHFIRKRNKPQASPLLVFGVGLTFGNFVGGWLADRWPTRSMFGIFLALAAVEAAMQVTGSHPAAAVITVFLWGVATFATVPGLQTRVLDQAKEAPALAVRGQPAAGDCHPAPSH